MRIFNLIRSKDISGVSGTGVVAEGVVFRDGVAVVRWLSLAHPSTNIYDNVEDVLRIHGHEGSTKVEFIE
jgi:hypothetical protein